MSINNFLIPFPDFKLNDIIDPDQHDLNNAEMSNKINEVIDVLNQITDSIEDGKSGADIISLTPITPFISDKLQTFLEDVIAKLTSTTQGSSGAGFVGTPAIAGLTGTNVASQIASIKALLDSYNTRITSNTNNITSLTNNKANKSETYTKAEVDAKVRGTDTNIWIEPYIIVNSNNGDGTFTYKDENDVEYTGTISPEGYQIFTLRKGSIMTGRNRIKAIINDTLIRSVTSGGLIEINSTTIALTSPVGNGTEVTFEYFETIAVSGSTAFPVVQSTPPSMAVKPLGFGWIDTSS